MYSYLCEARSCLFALGYLLSSSAADAAAAGMLVHFTWVEMEAFSVDEVVENKGSELACINHCHATTCGKSIHFDADSQSCELGIITAMGPKGAKSTSAVRVIAAEEDIPTERATHVFVTRSGLSNRVDLTLSPATSPPIEHPNFPSWAVNAVGFWYLGAALICGGNDKDYCAYYSFARGEAGGTTDPLSRVRRGAMAMTYQGRPWILGGEEGYQKNPTETTEVLSADGTVWAAGHDLPTVLVDGCAAALNDDATRHLVAGGKAGTENDMATTSAWIHDESDPGVWTPVPDMASGVARRQMTCDRVTLSDGRDVVVVAGGKDASNVPVDNVDVFDIAAGTWATGPDLLQPRGWGTLINVDGRLLLVGGHYSGGYSDAAHEVLELRLDLSGWDEVAEMAHDGTAVQQAVPFVY